MFSSAVERKLTIIGEATNRLSKKCDIHLKSESAIIALRNRIILAGFSQGGAVALYSGLTSAWPLAGIVALSTYLPLLPSASNESMRIWAAHGTQDEVIPLSLSQASYSRLTALQLEMHVYPMAHEISLQEITDLRDWLTAQIG